MNNMTMLEYAKKEVSISPRDNNNNKIVSNETKRLVLKLFESREVGVIQFAKEVGVSLTTLYYWIHHFNDHGYKEDSVKGTTIMYRTVNHPYNLTRRLNKNK